MTDTWKALIGVLLVGAAVILFTGNDPTPHFSNITTNQR